MSALKDRRAGVDVESVVADLRAIDHTTAWERTLAVGRIVFEGIFAGDAAEWKTKRSKKTRSLRKLVGHPQCPFKKSALSAAVNVYLFTQDRPEARQLARISPTHVSTVCSLPAPVACEMLTTADGEGWTVRHLAERVQQARRELGERRGRPRAGPDRRAETMGRRALRKLQRMKDLLERGDELDDACRARLVDVLEAVAETSARIQSLRQLKAVQLPTLARARTAAQQPAASVAFVRA